MGLTLPAQISAPAAAALGTSWPQVDEDSVDGLAAALDRCADELDSHAQDADRHTQGVLAASSGGLARGLAPASAALVGAADSTAATTAVQLRAAASELVSDAAEVRGTKVVLIHDLSTLTERLALLKETGPLTAGGSSLLPADEVDRAALGIAHRHTELVQVLGGTGLSTDGNPERGGPVAGLVTPVSDAGATATSALAAAGGGPGEGLRPAGSALDLPAPGAHLQELPNLAPVAGSAPGPSGPGIAAGGPPAEPAMRAGDDAGAPLAPAGPAHGSLGVGGLAGVTAQAAAAHDLASPPTATAAPATVLGAGPSAAGTTTAATFGPAVGGSAGGVVGGGHVVGAPAGGVVSAGHVVGGPAGGAPVADPPGPGPARGGSFVGVGPGQPSAGAPTGAPPGSAAPRPVGGLGAADLGSAALPSSTPAGARPAAAMVVDGAPAPRDPAAGQALVPHANDPSVLLLFVAFPAGTAPVRTARPARQLPPAVREARPGLCCPPGDHPAHPDLALPRQPAPVPAAVPVEGTDLLRGWDPLGGGNEHDLERRFVVRPATDGHPAEHFWPPAELHPEGAVAPDRRRPVRLEVGALLDLLGSPEGRVLAEGGTPFARRAEPAANAGRPLRRLRVARVLPAWESHLSAWFAQPGGGLRYRLTHPVAELVATGWLVDAAAEEPRGR